MAMSTILPGRLPISLLGQRLQEATETNRAALSRLQEQLSTGHKFLLPSELPIEALHASIVRLMTHFVVHPSADLADAVTRMLFALSAHESRYVSMTGVCIYAQAASAWRSIVTAFEAERAAPRETTHAVH